MRPAASPIAIAVFHAPGCGHCEEYLPRLRNVAARFADCAPTYLVDVQQNPAYTQTIGIEATPTTVVLERGRPRARLEGAAKDEEIEALFLGAARCSVESSEAA